jgi:uncharacterized membrane protein
MRNVTKDFWSGFAAGAAAGAGVGLGSMFLWRGLWQSGDKRILRIESSIQIARGVDEVFALFQRLEELPRFSPMIQRVRSLGNNRSRWRVRFDGTSAEWDAEIEQLIRNQSIGWKSVNGPKHSGRLIFSSVDGQTVLQVRMNYAPPFGVFTRAITPVGDMLHHALEQALRDIKTALEEGKRFEPRLAQTGTAPQPSRPGHMQHSRFGGSPSMELNTPPPSTAEIKK